MRTSAVRPARSQTLFAFLDESHTASNDEDPGAYTVAAVVLSDLSLDRCRAVMQSLRLGGSQKLHWREESRGRRRSIIEAVASLRVRHIVVTRPPKCTRAPRTSEATLPYATALRIEFTRRYLCHPGISRRGGQQPRSSVAGRLALATAHRKRCAHRSLARAERILVVDS